MMVQGTYGKKGQDFQEMTSSFIEFLHDLPSGKVIRAMEQHVRTNKVFPTPADILEKVESMEFPHTDEEIRFRDVFRKWKAANWGLAQYALSEAEQIKKDNYEKLYEPVNTKNDWITEYDRFKEQQVKSNSKA